MKTYSEDDIRAKITKELEGKSQASLAKAVGVTPAYINRVVKGVSYGFGKILDYFGIERVVIYRDKKVKK